MSTVLQSLKIDLIHSRNMSYYGKYIESISEFSKIITRLEGQISQINDKLLLAQWNKLLQEVKFQKNLVQQMIETLSGHFQTQHQNKKNNNKNNNNSNNNSSNNNQNQNHRLRNNNNSINQSPKQNKKNKYPFGKQPFKKQIHQDDQLYNKKLRQNRDQEIQRQKLERQKIFQQKQAQIWPKKKPVMKKYNNNSNNINKSNNDNKSNVNDQNNKNGRDYDRPWLKNANKKKQNNNKQQNDDKKSFLKAVYPDGQGPDTNLIEMLERQVIDFSPNITFDDIAQLEKAKELLTQAVILPLALPHLFKGNRRSWKGVLLFGPPGTGKTLLAKAIASSGKTTFFNVTASSLASKWKGQSEKLVRLLFEMAKFYAPSTIFIDEIDALASKRGQRDDQSSRKVKTQLMTRIDGASTEQDVRCVVIGATNRPWDLDQAIRRRLQKRVYIPLPTQKGRRQVLKINLKNEKTDNIEIQQLVNRTKGYSGADLAGVCRDAAYMPMRRQLKKQNGLGNKLKDLNWVQEFQKQVNVPLSMQDFNQALKNVKPSVGKADLANYEEWMAQFGQQGTN